jgi:hypothetical protein
MEAIDGFVSVFVEYGGTRYYFDLNMKFYYC